MPNSDQRRSVRNAALPPRAIWMVLLCALIGSSMSGCQKKQPSNSPTEQPTTQTLQKAESPENLTALYNRGVGLMGQFKYDEAVKVFEQLKDSAPDALASEVQVDLAIAFLNRRQGDDLVRSAGLLDQVGKADPGNLRAPYCRALLDFNDGKTGAARELFQQVATGDPQDSYALYYVGQCLFSGGDYAAALDHYDQAQRIDPYLRSAYYGAFQAAQRLKDKQRARASLADFQRLATNPRARLAELKYTRMGPKATVRLPESLMQKPAPLPAGPLFGNPTPLPIKQLETEPLNWRTFDSFDSGETPTTITIADIDGDGSTDLFLAGAIELPGGAAGNAILLWKQKHYVTANELPLAAVSDVTAALWGDYDDDGLMDLYLCRRGPNQLWRQAEKNVWKDVTKKTNTDAGDHRTTDGALYDLDHDGDLDILLANSEAPVQVLNNDRNGSFREISGEIGIGAESHDARQVVLADLDSDDDADILVLKDKPPHVVYRNDRLWRYEPADGFDQLLQAELSAITAIDTDVDGHIELFSIGTKGVQQWSPTVKGEWQPKSLAGSQSDGRDRADAQIGLVDVDGDQQHELLTYAAGGWKLTTLSGKTLLESPSDESVAAPGILTISRGPELIACRSGKAPLIWPAGKGRHQFALLQMFGRTDKALEMRSNSSGIGVKGVARLGTNWVAIPETQPYSAPGQSLQPTAIGMGTAAKIDFIRLLWPDAVSQTELDLKPGKLHKIAETQRQAGSCPLLFVWDGQQYTFVADLLGAGGIGFNLGKGEYYDARPTENFLLPAGLLQPREGRMVLKLGEPMEEICYFDAIRLVAIDVPPEWNVTLDERFGASEPLPTGETRFYRHVLLPIAAVNDRGKDVLAELTDRDGRAAPLDRTDRRFIGLTNPHSITLTFDSPLDQLADPFLVFDGWVEYAYSQTAFAAWQAGSEYVEPTIEAMGADGKWQPVFKRFGYMAGTPRESSVPLNPKKLPEGTRALRISTNMQIYWDRFRIVDVQHCPLAKRTEMPLASATVGDVGFSTRRLGEQRYTVYDYTARPPFGDTRHPSGFYTAFGDATELVHQTDDALAIIGPGEELHLEYKAPDTEPPAGWTRHWLVEADGWCKDADLFTQNSGTVEPLPKRKPAAGTALSERSEKLHKVYNTRLMGGR